MENGYLQRYKYLKEELPVKYIDLTVLVIYEDLRVLVFTNDCKFISRDTKHLTKAGAQFFADILEKRPDLF